MTLVELLVVLALLALLASITVPALARARRSVDRVSCLHNLHQWGVATSLYLVDNEDLLPPDGAPNGISRRSAWYTELPRTIGERPYPEAGPWRTNPAVALPRNGWICPANPRRSNGNSLFHYCLNRLVNGSGSDSRPVRFSGLGQPARTVWLFDNGRLAAVAGPNNVHPSLHGGGAQILFLDGHAERRPARDYWDSIRRRGLTNASDLVWSP